MNQLQRNIILDAYIQHLENGNNGDPAGAYTDIRDFFKVLIESDKKLKDETIIRETEYLES